MTGLCSSEIFLSLSLALSTLPVPKGTMGVVFAIGNQITCNFQGFVHIFGCVSFNFYLCGLTGYFLLAIRLEASDEIITKYYEPLVHVISVGYALFGAIFVLIRGGYFTSDGICWIAPKPIHCNFLDDVECTSGSDFYTLMWTFLAGPIILSFCIITTNMLIIFWTLMSQNVSTSMVSSGAPLNPPVSPRTTYGVQNSSSQLQREESDEDVEESDEDVEESDEDVEEGALLSPQLQGEESNGSESLSKSNYERKPSFIQLYEESKKKSKKLSKAARIRKDGMQQALLYIGMFSICNVIAFVHHVLEALENETAAYVFFVMQKCVYPLQGFLIFCIFTRPRIIHLRRSNSSLSFIKAFISSVQSRGEMHNTRRRVPTPINNNGRTRRVERRSSETFNAIISSDIP